MKHKSIWLLLISIVVLALLSAFDSKNYLLLSFAFLILTMAIYFWRFEKSGKNSREVVFIAIICALAVAGRVAFAAIPSVKPEIFILILGAIVSGADTGFLMGTIIALASNMYFGQGAWTPWQMFGLGLIGLVSGLIFDEKTPVWLLTLWGFIAAFLFGWIMDIYYILGFVRPISLKSIVVSVAASFPFDVVHAIFTAILLFLLGKAWLKIFNRYQAKYQLFDHQN